MKELTPYQTLLGKLDSLKKKSFQRLNNGRKEFTLYTLDDTYPYFSSQISNLKGIFSKIGLHYFLTPQQFNLSLMFHLMKDLDAETSEIIIDKMSDYEYGEHLGPKSYSIGVLENKQTELNKYINRPDLHKTLIKDLIKCGKETSKPVLEYFLEQHIET